MSDIFSWVEICPNFRDGNRSGPLLYRSQVTTFSRLLTEGQKNNLCERLGRRHFDIQIINLQQVPVSGISFSAGNFSDRIRATMSS
jgi:hypothetical protein